MFKRKEKQLKKAKKVNPYDIEEQRILKALMETNSKDEDYKKLQEELKNTIQMRGDSKESKRRISKQDKGSILTKLVGGGLVLGGLGLVSFFEMKGNTYTGEKRTFADGFIRTLGKFMGIH